MTFDFDAVIERRGTRSNKWDGMAERTGVDAADGIPMWVADMDFAAPEPVRARLAARVEHGVFGYYGPDDGWRAAVCGWSARRHGWEVDPDWITPSAGVCAALGLCCQAFSAPGDGVVVFSPVYHAFYAMIRANGRDVIESPLMVEQGRHRMDLEALGASLPPHARIMFLCSPHNPGGRVWTAEELRALGAFCAERDLILVSDEIWRDLLMPGGRHVATALAAPEIADRLVTCTAPSKTFNLAGGATAEVAISDPALRQRYRTAANAAHGMSFNLFGVLAAEAAYESGAPWLDALIPYLAVNQTLLAAGLAEAVPGARAMTPEATYLSWVDFSAVDLPDAEIARRVREDARIGVNAGPSFGLGGEAHMRFNVACPRSMVETAVERLSDAFADLR